MKTEMSHVTETAHSRVATTERIMKLNGNLCWLVCLVAVLAGGNVASAAVISLDMNTTPTANGFTMAATTTSVTQDITTNPGQLTMNIQGGTCQFSRDITDGLGSGSKISFGATITFDDVGGYWEDRVFNWNYMDAENNRYAASMLVGTYGAYTNVTFGASSQNVDTVITLGQANTFRIDIDKVTNLGTFYFNEVKAVFTASVIKPTGSGYSFITFGDLDGGVAGHNERWDNVFFTNEAVIPEPSALGLLSLSAMLAVTKRRRS